MSRRFRSLPLVLLASSIGDQKEAMVRVLELVAR